MMGYKSAALGTTSQMPRFLYRECRVPKFPWCSYCISADSQQQNLYHCLLHFLLTPLCRSSSPFGGSFSLHPHPITLMWQCKQTVSIRYVNSCIPFYMRYIVPIFIVDFCFCLFLDTYESFVHVAALIFMAVVAGLELLSSRRIFLSCFISSLFLSFYISLSPNHYFVISNGSFLPSGLLCCKCNYFRLTNAKKSLE